MNHLRLNRIRAQKQLEPEREKKNLILKNICNDIGLYYDINKREVSGKIAELNEITTGITNNSQHKLDLLNLINKCRVWVNETKLSETEQSGLKEQLKNFYKEINSNAEESQKIKFADAIIKLVKTDIVYTAFGWHSTRTQYLVDYLKSGIKDLNQKPKTDNQHLKELSHLLKPSHSTNIKNQRAAARQSQALPPSTKTHFTNSPRQEAPKSLKLKGIVDYCVRSVAYIAEVMRTKLIQDYSGSVKKCENNESLTVIVQDGCTGIIDQMKNFEDPATILEKLIQDLSRSLSDDQQQKYKPLIDNIKAKLERAVKSSKTKLAEILLPNEFLFAITLATQIIRSSLDGAFTTFDMFLHSSNPSLRFEQQYMELKDIKFTLFQGINYLEYTCVIPVNQSSDDRTLGTLHIRRKFSANKTSGAQSYRLKLVSLTEQFILEPKVYQELSGGVPQDCWDNLASSLFSAPKSKTADLQEVLENAKQGFEYLDNAVEKIDTQHLTNIHAKRQLLNQLSGKYHQQGGEPNNLYSDTLGKLRNDFLAETNGKKAKAKLCKLLVSMVLSIAGQNSDIRKYFNDQFEIHHQLIEQTDGLTISSLYNYIKLHQSLERCWNDHRQINIKLAESVNQLITENRENPLSELEKQLIANWFNKLFCHQNSLPDAQVIQGTYANFIAKNDNTGFLDLYKALANFYKEQFVEWYNEGQLEELKIQDPKQFFDRITRETQQRLQQVNQFIYNFLKGTDDEAEYDPIFLECLTLKLNDATNKFKCIDDAKLSEEILRALDTDVHRLSEDDRYKYKNEIEVIRQKLTTTVPKQGNNLTNKEYWLATTRLTQMLKNFILSPYRIEQDIINLMPLNGPMPILAKTTDDYKPWYFDDEFTIEKDVEYFAFKATYKEIVNLPNMGDNNVVVVGEREITSKVYFKWYKDNTNIIELKVAESSAKSTPILPQTFLLE